jgi:phosphoribosyl 1,2-cyclic phosphate phosphodiesterase
MKLLFLGTGGAMPTPRPFCQCETCKKARTIGAPYKRNSSSLFIKDINTVIDCGEDIASSLNRENIKKVENLFITHWHPDHTFGLRAIIEANFNFRTGKPNQVINLYVPKRVYIMLKEKYPSIDYFIYGQKTAKLHLIEDNQELKFKNITIIPIGFTGKNSETYGYLLKEKGKKILYSPCDTIGFKNYKNQKQLDLWISECGLFSKVSTEISFEEATRRIKEIKPKKVIFTHIEEIETNIWKEKHFLDQKKKYPDIVFEYAKDGQIVNI